MAEQMDPDELKLQQILDDSPMSFFDDGFDRQTDRRQEYSNAADRLSDDEHELGSDGELESDDELNEDVDKLEDELEEEDLENDLENVEDDAELPVDTDLTDQ